MEVELNTEEKQLIEKAAKQADKTIEQYLQEATQDFLKKRLGTNKKPVKRI